VGDGVVDGFEDSMWEDDLELAPSLTATNGPARGATFRLRAGVRVIGRAHGVDILVEDPKVSRRHATVERIDGRVLLTDAGSTNGTWRNDERVVGPVELADGDHVRVGNVTFRFFDPASARTEPVAMVGYLPASAGPVPVPGGGPGGRLATVPAVTGEPDRRRTAQALGTPTQPIRTPRSSRLLLLLSGCLALVAWMAWAYLTF
jgi:hypothetical protein